MKVVFNGVVERKTSGCIPCGKKRKNNSSFVHSKMYILPSGISKTFYVGRPTEVSDKDGEFLLKYGNTFSKI